MRNTPSYLKGLAETRARVSSEVLRLVLLKAQLDEKLQAANKELEACDLLIRKFDGRLNPELIKPVKGRRPYGKRGMMKESVARAVQEAFPEEISTFEIALKVHLDLGLDFASEEERRTWVDNCVRHQLKRFVNEGVIERLHETGTSVEVGRWRWKTDAVPSLDHLKAQAEVLGVGTQQASEE